MADSTLVSGRDPGMHRDYVEPAPSGLAAALAALQAELPRVGKDETAKVTSQRTGKTHTYTYATLGTVSQVIVPLLGKHGLAFIAKPTMHPEHGFVLNYALMHSSGEAQWGLYPLPGSGSPQEIGSAITYARRYCLCAVTGVAPDDDDDDAASAEQAHRQRADGLPTNADGSLSRSRTTDAEKAAAGVMTKAQQAEHTALQPKARELNGTVRRLTGIPSDADLGGPWLDQPAGESLAGTEDQPGTIGPDQQRAMHAAFTQAGVKDRTARLKLTADIIGRPVTSSNELSYTEAGRVLEELHGRVKA